MPQITLYHLSTAFSQTKLWLRLHDTELFAVKLPDGEIGYCSVMGMLGEHLALAVYPGREGLDSYRAILRMPENPSEIEFLEHMMGQDCVMCSFEVKSELEERDLKEIRDYGLKFRGKQAYPLFRRYRPRHVPWYVEGEKDEERLRYALTAGLEVACRLDGVGARQDMPRESGLSASKRELGFSLGEPFSSTVPLLEKQEDGAFAWSTTKLPDPAKPKYASPKLTDDLALAKLKKLRRTGAWECELFMYPEAMAPGEDDSRVFVTQLQSVPFYPYMLMMVDHEGGMVLHAGLSGDTEHYAPELIGAFVDGMKKAGIPGEILVRDKRTRALLAGVAEQLGIRLTMKRGLPLLEEAKEGLLQYVDEDKEASVSDLLDELLATKGTAEIPAEFLDHMASLAAEGRLPDAIRKKVELLLGRKALKPI